ASVAQDDGPPRLNATPDRLGTYVYNDNNVATVLTALHQTQLDQVPFAPSLHRVFCNDPAKTDLNLLSPVFELSVNAPPLARAPLFPDLGTTAVRSTVSSGEGNEQILVTWEGPLTGISTDSRKFGGAVTPNSDGTMTLSARGALLCGLGVQNGDFVQFFGCTT